MNYRQIKLLNDLETNVAELQDQVKLLLGIIEDNKKRIDLLENPPKRPRGRPPKVKH